MTISQQLYAWGSDPNLFYSSPLAASSPDGITWTRLPGIPFAGETTSCALAAKSPAGIWLVTNNTGNFSTSSDMIQWTTITEPNPPWMIQDLTITTTSVTNNFLVAGMIKDPITFNEQAFVAVSPAQSQPEWTICYQGEFDSIIHGITVVDPNNWIAVGSTAAGASPLLILTQDAGQTWENLSPPPAALAPGAVLYVWYDGLNIWCGGNSWFANAAWSADTVPTITNLPWSVNNLPKAAVTKIGSFEIDSATTAYIVLAGSTVWYSFNNTDWQSVSQPGYQFVSFTVFANSALSQNQLYLGVSSLLNQYSAFVGDLKSKGMTLVGINNGVTELAWTVA